MCKNSQIIVVTGLNLQTGLRAKISFNVHQSNEKSKQKLRLRFHPNALVVELRLRKFTLRTLLYWWSLFYEQDEEAQNHSSATEIWNYNTSTKLILNVIDPYSDVKNKYLNLPST